MGRIIFSREVIITAAILVVAVAAIMLTAHEAHDPHIANRLGAVVSALGALLVIVQVFLEISMEEKKESESASAAHLSPVNKEFAEVILAGHAKRTKDRRLKIVLCVAIVLVVGEILHGWGDLLVHHLPM